MRLASVPLPDAAGPSMAMIIARALQLAESGAPTLVHEAANSGKLVATIARVVDGHRLAAGEPHGEKGHGDAVIEVRRDGAAAADLACAAHGERVAFGAGRDAVGDETATVAASRSLSFTFSSASPSMRVSPSAKAATTARIGYSSIMLGARCGRHLHAGRASRSARGCRRPARRLPRARPVKVTSAPISRSIS